MGHSVGAVSTRTLGFVALGALVFALGLQLLTFGIWGDDGDPPSAYVAVATVVFLGAILTLIGIAAIVVRRRLAARHS